MSAQNQSYPNDRFPVASILFAAVWNQAPAQLSAQLGMSGTTLRALFRKHSVPMSPPGYWATVSAGRPVERAALPTPDDDQDRDPIRGSGEEGRGTAD